jgi:hypothetical protein
LTPLAHGVTHHRMARRVTPPRLPKTFGALVRAGGPERLAREAAERAAQLERRFWLDVLESLKYVNDSIEAAILAGYLRDLRRKLGGKAPRDREVVRAQTRERVRRYRERRRSAAL